jgi:hypothetical protein
MEDAVKVPIKAVIADTTIKKIKAVITDNTIKKIKA